MFRSLLFLAGAATAALVGCGSPPPERPGAAAEPDRAGPAPLAATAHDAYWLNLRRHCDRAYAGSLTLEPPGDEMLTGTEQLIVHFRDCEDEEIKAAFHIERPAEGSWDRSRTWVFLRTPDGLELRHDHRHRDGTPDDLTWYGGPGIGGGTPNRQEFAAEERSRELGVAVGWRVEILPEERYTYGTIREGEWTWRVDFDLSSPVPTPPPAWGHD